MSKIKVGDKVYVYGIDDTDLTPVREKATVEYILKDGLVGLTGRALFLDKCYDLTLVHGKQCRKIKTKK